MKKLFALFLLLLPVVAEAQKEFETDLWSPEDFPVNYAEEGEREQRIDLQAWLYSAQFKRLDLKGAITHGIELKHKPEVEMTIKGQVKYRSGHLLRNGRIIGYNFEDGKANEAQLDNEGRFTLPVYDFNDGESFFLQAYDKKGNADIYNYQIDNDTLPAMHNWLRNKQFNYLNDEFAELDLSAYGLDKDNLLPGVVVKGKLKREEHVPTNRFYSARYMSGEDIEKRNILTFSQLMKQFPAFVNYDAYWGFSMDPEEGESEEEPSYQGRATSTRGASTLGASGGDMPFILDGIKVELAQVFNLDPREISSIEILAPWQTMGIVGGYGCINGAVSIKTKQYSQESVVSKGIRYTPKGLANLKN